MHYPLPKYVVAFVVGIISTHYFNLPFKYSLLLIITLLLFAVIFHFTKQKKPITLLLLMMVVFGGMLYSSFRNESQVVYPFAETKISNTIIYGEIKEITLIHSDKFKIILHSDSVRINDSTITLENNFQCNISFTSKKGTLQLYNLLKIGNKLKVTGVLRKGRGKRNPGEFDYYKYLQSIEVAGIVYIKKMKDVTIVEPSINHFRNTIFEARKWVAKRLETSHNKRTASLLKGLLLADRSEIDYRTKESFINSGVIHVLAVSGLHVGFIVLIFIFLTSRISIYPRTILTVIGLTAFLLLTGSPASVFRATIMVVVVLIIYLSNRTYNSVNGLSIAALILLLIDPSEIFNPGFQLSFSAVLSILIVYPILSEKITTKKRVLRYLLLFSAVSFSAQLGTLPFTLIYFQKLSIISLFANLLVIPIIGIIVGLGVLTIFVSTFSTLFSLFFASANMLFTDILMGIVDITGTQQFSYFYIPNFSLIDGFIFYLFLIIIIYSVKQFSNTYSLVLLLFLIGLNLFFFLQLDNKELLPDGKFSIVMIDIGQGDGILLKFPNGETALVDAGNATPTFDNGERIIAPLLRRLSIKQIDYGFISHVDSDHYKGFLSLIKNGWIKKIYKPRIDTTLKKDIRLEEVINENDVKLKYYSKSKMMFGNVAFYTLNDTTNSRYKSFSANNKSGVYKIVHGNNSFLFVGDAEYPAEKTLVKTYGEFLDSDILKVGHHGSKSSSSQLFINAVTPDVGIISAGLDNGFGHPVKLILDRFQINNVELYRTDIEGAIILQSDGESVKKVNWREF
ncbi:MAG: DNA internalization-related competence protein ComEC/Rec2 [Melioribacteraceae bacterium]|nr:DNA internalization-related competence protein ComEC/Rec2 [Melioribacteraceae bacterium]